MRGCEGVYGVDERRTKWAMIDKEMEEEETDLRGESRGFLQRAKKLRRLGALNVLDFLIVEEADRGTAPYEPVPVMLDALTVSPSVPSHKPRATSSRVRRSSGAPTKQDEAPTSRLVTGFSISTRWVSFAKALSGSRSASSAKLFDVRTRVVRLGIDLASAGWMLVTRLRASRRVRRRGESGKLESCVMSLSVKSMASWSCSA
jgi:hypothetical protein